MRTVTVNRDSWHYKLARAFDTDGWNENICAYLRSLTIGLVICGLCLWMAFWVLYGAANTIAWFVVLVMHGFVSPDGAAIGFLFVATVASAIGIGYLFVKTLRRIPTPEVVTAAYESIHDKVCFRLQITGPRR